MKMISFFSFLLVMENQWNGIDRGIPKYSGKILLYNLSTTNPTWTVCYVLVFNNFNTTTHKVFTKFCIDECCEVDFTASA